MADLNHNDYDRLYEDMAERARQGRFGLVIPRHAFQTDLEYDLFLQTQKLQADRFLEQYRRRKHNKTTSNYTMEQTTSHWKKIKLSRENFELLWGGHVIYYQDGFLYMGIGPFFRVQQKPIGVSEVDAEVTDNISLLPEHVINLIIRCYTRYRTQGENKLYRDPVEQEDTEGPGPTDSAEGEVRSDPGLKESLGDMKIQIELLHDTCAEMQEELDGLRKKIIELKGDVLHMKRKAPFKWFNV